MKTLRVLSFVVLPLMIVGSALAQSAGTTSTLFGTVTTRDGAALPGVTVTISSPQLQGVRTDMTGSGGGYTFPALPPGSYTVKFSLEGMQGLTKKVNVALASTTRADAALNVGAVGESITVTASAPAVLETTQVGANFSKELVDELPVARNIRQTVLLAPGVNPNGVNNQITINGGPSYDNIFLVNGVVVNENLRGQPHNLFIEDAIQETTVLTAGISAEYGRFTGGVVSTLTKSGGNDFTGSFRDSLTNPKWTADVDLANAPQPPDKTNQVYEGTLGGRVIRDRLWFFAAGRKAKTGIARSTFQTAIPVTNGFDEKRYEGKLTAAITARHNVIGSYLDVKNLETNNIFGDVYDLDAIVPSRELPNNLASVSYSGIFTHNLLAEAAWATKEFAFVNSGGRFTDRIKGTYISDTVSGGFFNAPVFCGVCTKEERNSSSIGGKVSYFLSSKRAGNHTVVFGGDRFHETRIANNYQSASQYSITARAIVVGDQVFPRFDSTTTLRWQPIFVLTPGTDLNSTSMFVNDRWEATPRLSFNLGVRFDTNDAVDADGTVVSDDRNFSPRLGAMYDLTGTGKHRISATVGRYVAKIVDGSNVTSTGQAAGNPGTFAWAYAGPVVNPAGTPNSQLVSKEKALDTLFAWFDTIGGTKNTNFSSSSYPGYSSRFPDTLLSPSVDELTLGYGLQIQHNAYLRLDVIHRDWHNFYANQLDSPAQRLIPPNGVPNDVQYTVNDDEFTQRKYQGATLQASWHPGRVNIGGNYTWSKLEGNDTGEGAGTATVRNTPNEIFYPEYMNYAQRRPSGYLGQDRRHRARVWAGFDFATPVGVINLSAIQSYDSGFAYSAIGTIDATGRNANFVYSGIPANPGYTLSAAGNSHNYFFSKRGEFRSDSRSGTDLAINYSIPIMGRVTLFARGDILNVFNTQVVVDPSLINTDVITARTGGSVRRDSTGKITTLNSGLSPFNPFKDTPIQCPQNATAQACADMGAHYQLGPNFGNPNSADAFQLTDRSLAPRTYRVGAGVRF